MTPPKLLVSIRSVDEARLIPTGFCEILDVKEPQAGALGMASAKVLSSIADNMDSRLLASAALGELSERLGCDSIGVPERFGLLKLGLAGSAASSTWKSEWQTVRQQFSSMRDWVGVAYADFETAASPEPRQVLDAAIQCGCRFFLIDTFEKNGAGVFASLSVTELIELRERANAAGLGFALAGQLGIHNLSQVVAVAPDVVGIRGAACVSGERGREISVNAIKEFRTSLHQAFGAVAQTVDANSTPTRTS